MSNDNRFRVIPARFQNVVFAFFFSCLMTLVVSAITTLRNLGFDDASFAKWMSAFFSSWPVTFPTVLVVAPIVRRLSSKLVKSSAPDASPAASA